MLVVGGSFLRATEWDSARHEFDLAIDIRHYGQNDNKIFATRIVNMFFFFKVLSLLVGTSAMLIASIFSLASSEQWEEALRERYWETFAYRMLFCVIVAVIVELFSTGFFMFFRNVLGVSSARLWRILGWELLYYLICAFLLTLRAFMTM